VGDESRPNQGLRDSPRRSQVGSTGRQSSVSLNPWNESMRLLETWAYRKVFGLINGKGPALRQATGPNDTTQPAVESQITTAANDVPQQEG